MEIIKHNYSRFKEQVFDISFVYLALNTADPTGWCANSGYNSISSHPEPRCIPTDNPCYTTVVDLPAMRLDAQQETTPLSLADRLLLPAAILPATVV